ncbi:aldehyde-activating protein [Cypionkella aquatica]|uniref:Aldehyde-activating protein n=1 Tax=Cypionkella aquatica TaxID=1756042 RepID=A0AA37X0P9_9RHOB|nr:GFA family protein [Cypionkella aquatica]GLS85970.1 aldehyde-activating protein [Cypionkella aquatica]
MGHNYTGGCACGAVRYEKPGETVAELLCQCQHCRQRSGTGHSGYLVFADRAGFAVTGVVKTWDIAGDSGNLKHHAFCPNCGTPLFVSFAAAPAMIAIHPGSLDDPAAFAPQFVTYHARGQAWDNLDAGLQKFAAMPG